MIQYCKNCRYYSTNGVEINTGDCVRYPKKFLYEKSFSEECSRDKYDYPHVSNSEWCGEWKKQQECDCYKFVDTGVCVKKKKYNKDCKHCNGTGKIRR